VASNVLSLCKYTLWLPGGAGGEGQIHDLIRVAAHWNFDSRSRQIVEGCRRGIGRADAVDCSHEVAICQLCEEIMPVGIDPKARLGDHCGGAHPIHQRNNLAHPVIAMQ